MKGAIEVDEYRRTSLPDVYAAGDCVVTHHRLLGKTWLPLGTTAHKQGRIAGMPVDGISELDLSYTPPLGSLWDAVQVAAQAWMNEHHLDVQRRMPGAF